MAGLTPFQFSSGKRMYNTTFGLSTSAYGTNLLADSIKDTSAWQEMWINPNNVKWESNYRQSQKQTSQAIVTFHFRPDYQVLTCSGIAGWYRIKSQLEELKEQAIKTVISSVPNTASSDQLQRDKRDRDNKKNAYVEAQSANIGATNKYKSVFSAYGEYATDSICGYVNSLTRTMTQSNYTNYNEAMIKSLDSKRVAIYLTSTQSESFVTMFTYTQDSIVAEVNSLWKAFELMSVCKSSQANASAAMTAAHSLSASNVDAAVKLEQLSLSAYIGGLINNGPTDMPSWQAAVATPMRTMESMYVSGMSSIVKSFNTAITNMDTTTRALFSNKAASTLTISGMSNLYTAHLDTLFAKLHADIKAVNDTSYDDDVLKAYKEIEIHLASMKTSIIANYNSFRTASASALNVYISHSSDELTLGTALVSFKRMCDTILSQSKRRVKLAETELKQSNSNVAATKSNYEAAEQKYRNSKGGLKTAAKSIGSSYKNGFTKDGKFSLGEASSYLKSGHSNRINNSPSLFLSRLKLTADEPMYYIDGDGVEHYNPKYIKMFTKQYPDGVIYEGYFTSFNISETPDFETVTYDFRFIAEKKTPVTFLQRVLGMYSGYTSVAGDALNAVGS